MADTYFTSNSDAEKCKALLGKSPPSYRQAYSDRTAWVMAVLSELSYIKFNPLFKSLDGKDTQFIKDYFIKKVSNLVDESKVGALNMLIDKVGYDHQQEQAKLESNLDEFYFKLRRTFDQNGTQAMLVENDSYLVLVFRGTEPESLYDIKADAKATTRACETNGMIHSGFYQAFIEVRKEIEDELKKEAYKDKPLFVTGHSLGGALATVATKFLWHTGGLGACYTYGSPRVGNDDWINGIKTPIHRLVNAADCVTMLPPGDVMISSTSFLCKLIPGIGDKIADWLSRRVGGYVHAGNMRYLTNCEPGAYDDVKVLYSVSFTYRLKALIMKSLPFKKLLTDHSISTYGRKLMIIAFKRNVRRVDSGD
jgi:hypothetical protein